MTFEEMRDEIRGIKSLTDKPYGVDLLLPSALADSPPPNMTLVEIKSQFIPKEHSDFVEKLRKDFDVPHVESNWDPTTMTEEHSKKLVDVMLDEKVPPLLLSPWNSGVGGA